MREAWILAGQLDGKPVAPEPLAPVAGMPHLLRHACTLVQAGADRIVVVWCGDAPVPSIEHIARDERLGGATLEISTAVPEGDAGIVLVVRADRVFHRDLPKLIAAAVADSSDPKVSAEIAGEEYDSVVVVPRSVAIELAAAATRADGIAQTIAQLRDADALLAVAPPWRGFSMEVRDRKHIRRAEAKLVWSLRKLGDGIASRLVNRHISLVVSRVLMHGPIHPNHVTVFCFLSALAGGIVIAQGGYSNAVIGILLLELGSIIDGCDGELARLKYRFSRVGEWMDTVTDDFGNIFLLSGATLSLRAAGVPWAVPVGLIGIGAFLITQSSQYFLISVVYRSGDLAAIPWAFQAPPPSIESIRQRTFMDWVRATIPQMLKRDFFLTVFVVLIVAGRLDWVLAVFAAGAVSFLVSFLIQLVRNRSDIAAQLRRQEL